MLFRLPRPGDEPVVNRTCPICGCTRMHIRQHQRQRGTVGWRSDTIRQVRVKCPCCGKTATCRVLRADTQRTNNTAEQMIGLLLKIRSKMMRGSVKPDNLLRFVHVAAHVWKARGVCKLKAVC